MWIFFVLFFLIQGQSYFRVTAHRRRLTFANWILTKLTVRTLVVRRLRMFLVLFFCPLTFFYRVDAATTALVLLKETRRTINTCSCLFMFSNTLLTQRECLHALYTLTLARVMDFFPHLTSVLAALATSATIASLLQQPVGFKKKKNLSLSSCSSRPSFYFGWLLIITGSILMCMLHYGVAAGLFKSVSLGGEGARDVQDNTGVGGRWPPCVSFHHVYPGSNMLFTRPHMPMLSCSHHVLVLFFSFPGQEICSSDLVTSSSIKRLFV